MRYDRQQLIELIQKEALQYGDFTLASGKKSHFYLDCRKVTLSSAGAALIAAGILERFPANSFDAIGGLTLGADPILAAVLALAGAEGQSIRGFIVRAVAKDHGTGRLVEGPLREGDRVLIVDDVATSGQSCLKAIDAIAPLGCTVVGVMTVVDRQSGAAAALAARNAPLHSLLTLGDLGLAGETR